MRHVFEEHVFYEIGRLVDTYQLLLKPDEYWYEKFTPQIGEAIKDALIVGFCTHARNLLEFFYRKSGKDPASVDYADPPYEHLDQNRNDVDTLKNKLNNQINHLSYGRTKETSEKIGPNDRKRIIKLIHSDAVRLKDRLKPGYDAKYLLIDRLAAASAADVGLSAASFAETTTTPVWGMTKPSSE